MCCGAGRSFGVPRVLQPRLGPTIPILRPRQSGQGCMCTAYDATYDDGRGDAGYLHGGDNGGDGTMVE